MTNVIIIVRNLATAKERITFATVKNKAEIFASVKVAANEYLDFYPINLKISVTPRDLEREFDFLGREKFFSLYCVEE